MSDYFNVQNILTVVEDLQKGVQEKIDLVTQQEDAWKYIDLNIGLVGESRPGKSAFINRLCGTKTTASRAAKPVTKPLKYPHPKNEKVAFWDLPPVGAPGFPKADYLSKIAHTKWHFFVLFSEGPFSANEVKLAEEMQRKGLSYFCVQTASGKAPSPAQVKGKKVYVVDSSKLGKWDFPQLMEDINKSLDDTGSQSDDRVRQLADLTTPWNIKMTRSQVLMLTLEPMSKKLIQLKADALRRRALIVAIMAAARSGGLAAIPIIGSAVKACLNSNKLGEEIQFYTEQFDLIEEFQNYLSKQLGISSGVDAIDSYIGEYVKKSLSNATKEAVTRAAQCVIESLPAAGPLLSAATSFGAAYFVLTEAIDRMRDMAEGAATG